MRKEKIKDPMEALPIISAPIGTNSFYGMLEDFQFNKADKYPYEKLGEELKQEEK